MDVSGPLHVAAAVAMVGFWYLYALVLPFKRLRDGIHHLALHPAWTGISLAGGAGCTLAVLALASTWRVHVVGESAALDAGMLLAMSGLILLAGNLFWEAILWPTLARESPTTLAFDGPIYRNRTLLGFFGLAGLVFSGGYVLLAVALPQPPFPEPAVWCLGFGAPMFALGPLFGGLQVTVRSVGITLLALGHGWVGVALLG